MNESERMNSENSVETTSVRDARGILCPRCGQRRFQTTHTQPQRDNRIRRRKKCRACGHKIVTYEAANGSAH